MRKQKGNYSEKGNHIKISFIQSLQFKIVSAISAVIIVFIVLLEIIGSLFTKNLIQTNIFSNYKHLNHSMSENIISRLGLYMGGVATISENINIMEMEDRPEYNEYTLDAMRSLQVSDSHIQLLFAGTESGKQYIYPQINIDADLRKRPWYIQAKENPDTVQYTQPYEDLNTKEFVITVMKAIHKNNKFIGVLGADIEINSIKDYLEENKFSKTGLSYLVNADDNKIIVHSDASKKNTDLESSILKVIKGGNENLEVVNTKDNKKKIVLSNYLESLHSYLVTEIDYSEVAEISDNVTNKLLLFGIISGVVLIGLGYAMAHIIVTSIKKLTFAAEKIADGDFQVDLNIKSKSELGVLSNAFQRTIDQLLNYQGYIDEISEALMSASKGDLDYNTTKVYTGQFEKLKVNMTGLQKNLSNILLQILDSSKNVNESSFSVSEAANSLSSGASEQAGTIEELSASVANITNQIRLNSADSAEAMEKAELANTKLSQSTEQMQDMMSAMEEISDKSSEITKIVKMIDDIAFQTNILALNAAVEAARAGEAGKGFAVVADEVRNLAGRSAEAVKTTTKLIEKMGFAVNNGTQIANKTSETLSETETVTKETMLLINNISAASKEQSNHMEEINHAVDLTSSIVQNNASTAKDSADISEQLNKEAERLKNLVSQFKLKN